MNFNLYSLEMPERPEERLLRVNIKLFFFKGGEVISCPSDLLLENSDMCQLTEQGLEENILIHNYKRVLAESTEGKQFIWCCKWSDKREL